MAQSKRQRRKRQLAELEASLDDALALPDFETASIALKDHLAKSDTESLDRDQQLNHAARSLLLSTNALIAAHVEHGADIRKYFGAMCPVHENNWECLDQAAVP